MVEEPWDDIIPDRLVAGRMNETECEERAVTVPWMNWRRGISSSPSARESDEVDDAGLRGGVGSLEPGVGVGVDADEDDPISAGGSGGSSIFEYGINALGA